MHDETEKQQSIQFARELIFRSINEEAFDISRALETVQQILDIARHYEDVQLEADGILRRGGIHIVARDFDAAWPDIIEATRIANTIGDLDTVGKTAMLSANMLQMNGKFVEALEKYDRALELARVTRNPTQQAVTLNNMAIVHWRVGDSERALSCVYEALFLLEHQESDQRVLVGTLSKLAAFCLDTNQLDTAREHLERALGIATEIGSLRGLAILHSNMAGYYRKIGDDLSAFQQFQLAYENSEACGDVAQTAKLKKEMADLLASQGDMPGALAQAWEAARTFEELGDRALLTATLVDIGGLLIRSENPSEAIKCLEHAQSLAEEIGFKEGLYCAHEHLASAYGMIGEHATALQHYRAFHEVKEKVFNDQSDHRVQALHVMHETERAKHEAELQRTKAEHLQQELSMKTTQLSSQALHVAKQTELLSRFRNELREIVRRTNDAEKAIKAVKEKLKELPCATIDWEKFDEDFRGVHPNFESNLREGFPDLTSMELKICMLLKLQMTSADIATMLCLSERNIENHRYRIRHKLGLAREQNLHQVLEGF